MKTLLYCLTACLLGATVAWGQEREAPRGRTEAEEGVEVLARGPVHEAFAGTVTYNPEPGIMAPKAPPEAIEELPPEQRPTGDNVAWIPGYWAWDDERSDFLWISGQAIQKFRQERQKLEAKAAVTSAANTSQRPEPAKVKFSRSPIVARSAKQFGRDQAPPKGHVVLKPDLQVKPKPRPKVEPRPRPAVQPKPSPKVDPKPSPKVDPKPKPKVGPKPKPKVGPKPSPKVGPKPRPKVQPQKPPKQDKGKEKSKEKGEN